MRTYERTHPWITFKLDLREANYKHWLLLGEANSKCDHIAGIALLPAIQKHLSQVYLAKGVLATTAIEGNTLTEEEVLQHFEKKLNLPPSKEYLGKEIDNVIEACNLIGRNLFTGKSVKLCVREIKNYNKLILKDLPHNEDVIPGDIRTYNVGIGRYKGAPPEDCEYLLDKLCEWINSNFNAPEEYKISFGIIKAIISHIYIAWIHPFGDGNGRTARLVEFQILLSAGVPATAAHLLSNHYNLTRAEYYRQLDRASKSGGDLFPFMIYALQGFVDGLKEQIGIIKRQQLTVHWINYIHERFRNRDSATNNRRRRLLIDLSLTQRDNSIPLSKIRHITPQIAEAYAHKTDKTVKRDIITLEEMGLVERDEKGIRAKPEIMMAFLPPTLPASKPKKGNKSQ